MTVKIIGAGIGGLSLALALAKRGIASTVIEQAPILRDVGAGIQLSPNACRFLFDWGLEDQLRSTAVAPSKVEVRDAMSGRLLTESQLGDAASARWGAPYLVLTRAALQAALLAAVERGGFVDMRMGQVLLDVEDVGERVSIVLAGGETLSAEVVMGCDGLRSKVREVLFDTVAPRFTGQTAWRGLARMSLDEPSVRVWTGPARHFVRYAVGPDLVNMVAVTEATAVRTESWDEIGRAETLAAEFKDWPEEVRATIGAVERPWRSELYDRPPLRHWTKGRVGLLGDAAHPMLPFLAQGAAMAIEDAWVAAELLSATVDPKVALREYEKRRRPRTAKVQAWATRNAFLFHLPERVAACVFGAAKFVDTLYGAPPEARFDWLYGPIR